MKKIKLFLAAVAAMVGVGAYAQTWTGNEVAAGTYYLYNIGADKYFNVGDPSTGWGTHAYLTPTFGIDVDLTLSNGAYTIDTKISNGGNNHYLKADLWADGAALAWTFTSVEVAGYSHVYTIKNGDNYLVAGDDDDYSCTKMATATTLDGNKGYWQLVTKNDVIAYLIDKATPSTPQNATFLLPSANFDRNDTRTAWTQTHSGGNFAFMGKVNSSWGSQSFTDSNSKFYGIESYGNTYDITQTLTLPNGKYEFTCQGFDDNESANSYIYAGSVEAGFVNHTPGTNALQTALENIAKGQYTGITTGVVTVTGGTLKVGFKRTTSGTWAVFDNARLICHDLTVEAKASALPADGVIGAGKWYYYDALEGTYNISNTAGADIYYTTEANAFDGDVATKFDATAELSAARYYVKASTATTLTIAAQSFSYELGEATYTVPAYAKTIGDVTINFANALSNNPDATLTLVAGSKALLKQGESTVEEAAITAGEKSITFSFSTALAVGTAYTISVPAGVYGYADVSTNTAINITVNGPVFAEGVYYLQNVANDQFLTHGGSWGTEATTGSYGLAWDLAMLSDGSYTLRNVSRSALLGTTYLGSGAYTDDATAYGWTFEKTGDNFYMKYVSGNYLCPNTEGTYGYTYFGNTGEAVNTNAIVWKLLTKAEYEAFIATTIANQSTLAETVADADTYRAVDMTESIKNASLSNTIDDWTQINTNGNNGKDKATKGDCAEVYDATGGLQQTISGLAAGIYKVTASACWRPCGDKTKCQNVTDYDVTRYFFANTATSTNQVQIKKWSDGNSGETPWSRDSFVSMKENYVNTLYVNVAEGEALTIGVGGAGNYNSSWMPFCDFTLTYYTDQVEADAVNTLIASIPTDAMAKTDKDALAEAKSALEASTTIKNYNALDAAIKAAAPSIAQYKTYNYYISAFNANIEGSATAAGVQAQYEEGTVESVEAIVAAYRTYALGTLATDKVTDYTAIIINPGFETGPTLDNYGVIGWDVNSAAGEAFISPNVSNRAFTPGHTGNLFNTWNGSSFWLRQSFGVLPVGQYRLTGYLSSDANNQYTVKVGAQSESVTTGDTKVGTPVAVIFTSDGTTATQFDITTDKWFKADNFTLTLIGDGTSADLTKLVAAVNTPTSKLGFEDGEYAPYANVDNIAAVKNILAEVQALGTLGSYELAAYIAQVEAITWKANEGEVNAIPGNKTFAEGSYTHSGSYDLPNGWSNTGYNTRIQGISEGTNNKGLQDDEGNVVRHAMLVKYETSYGKEEGYTLPLKKNTRYEFSFEYGLWNEGGIITKGLTVTAPDGSTIEMTPATVSKNEGDAEKCGHNVNTAWYKYKAYFTTAEAGDYILNIVNTDAGNQRQMAFSDLELKKAVATNLALDEAAAVEFEYPYDLRNVTLARTFNENWATFVVPFDIDNATLKAQFGDDVQVSTISASDKTGVQFTAMDEPAITANVPVIMKTSTTKSSFTFDNVFVQEGTPTTTPAEGVSVVGNYGGKVSIPGTTGEDTNAYYYIASNLMKHSTGSQTIKGFRAYFSVAADAEAKAFFDSFSFDLPTAVEGVEAASSLDNATVYNLAGQRVEQASRLRSGIYIVNGKKVLVK